MFVLRIVCVGCCVAVFYCGVLFMCWAGVLVFCVWCVMLVVFGVCCGESVLLWFGLVWLGVVCLCCVVAVCVMLLFLFVLCVYVWFYFSVCSVGVVRFGLCVVYCC